MATTGVRVEGLDTLVRTLKKAGVDVADLKDASKKAGDTVTSAAVGRAPRRTGRLASSVRPSRLAKGVRVSVGRATVPFAGAIHWGWPARNITAQPFLTDAAKQTEPVWVAQYLEDIEKILDGVKGV